jgi:ATP-dependent DNA helicase RecG
MESVMKEEELLELIKQGESQAIELTARPNPEMGRSIVAFANTNDGIIIIGVSDDKKIQGCSVKDEQSIANIAHDCKPSIYPEIEKIEKEGKLVFVVRVKKSGSGVDYAHKNIVYKRVGTHDKPMSPKEVVHFARSSGLIPFDSEICASASYEDLDENKVDRYLEKREEIRKIKKPQKLSYDDLLFNLKALQRTPQGLLPTNAGILFFGKNPQGFFTQSQLRVVKFKGVKLTHPIIDRLDGSGTLWEMVEEAEDFIRKTIRLLGLRTEKSFMREDKFEYPIKALREAMINALIHRNYFEFADTRVLIFDNRIEVVNPGAFPEGVTPRRPFHTPVNHNLCALMYDIGFIEKLGTGIHMMKELCRQWGNKVPHYKINKYQTTIVFETRVKGSTVIEERKNGVLLNENILQELNSRQVNILEYIQTHKKITTSECKSLFPDSSERTIRNDLKDLESRGLLGKSGSTKGSFYYAEVEYFLPENKG